MLSFRPTFKKKSFKFISSPLLQPAIHTCGKLHKHHYATQALCLGKLNQCRKFCSLTTGLWHMQTKGFIMHLYPIVPLRDIPSLQHHCNKVHVLWNAIWQIVLWDTNGLSPIVISLTCIDSGTAECMLLQFYNPLMLSKGGLVAKKKM